MPKVSPLQGNFNGGEISPLLFGRVDAERYRSSLGKCQNYIPTTQGGLIRRTGSEFVAEVKTSSKSTRLERFEFSITQAYILEFGDQYIRFYMDNGQILSLGVPYEIVSPYLEADLFQLKFTQSDDVLYIVHPDYPPNKLSRTSHTNWTLTPIDFLDGPYLAVNATTTTLACSATTGSITVTASAAAFVATDVGRLVRIKKGATWGYVKITAFTDTTHVSADVKMTIGATGATLEWRLGVWSETTGYPGCVVFHQDRLCFGGASNFPQRIDGSNSSDYENFTPTAVDGSVVDSNALSFSLNSNDVNVIRWLTSDEKGMLAGSVAGEWVVKPASITDALSPTNITANRATSFGSADIQPVQAGKSTLFIQRSGRKVRELTYFYDVDGFRANDLTQLAEHITGKGLVQMAYQKEPQSLVWCVRQDGVLAVMTYEHELDSLKVGWSRQLIGGYSDAANSAAMVESVAVIPSPDGTRQEAWLVVKRYINGSVKRYVEFVTRFFEDLVEQKDAFFVDAGLTHDDPKTITAATTANPVVVTSASHGFSNGQTVRIDAIKGMNEINSRTFTVSGVTTDTFELSGQDGTAYGAYVSGGEARKLVSVASGLDHLEGQSVSILADGAVQPNKTVVGGSINLSSPAAVIHAGLGFQSDAQMLRLEAGAADGTALGKTRRTHRVGFFLHRSLGLKIGMDFDNLDTLSFRSSSDPMGTAPALFTGIVSENINSDYDFENQICWRQDQPLPSTILAVMPQMVTQDRG